MKILYILRICIFYPFLDIFASYRYHDYFSRFNLKTEIDILILNVLPKIFEKLKKAFCKKEII